MYMYVATVTVTKWIFLLQFPTTQAYTSVIFIAIYVTEVVLGVIAYTCILHPKGYLRRGWTTLDLAVIIFG